MIGSKYSDWMNRFNEKKAVTAKVEQSVSYWTRYFTDSAYFPVRCDTCVIFAGAC